MTVPRKQLPIRQRHAGDCTRPSDCACPWSFRVRLPDGTMPRVTRDTYDQAEQGYYELMARRPEPLADKTTTIAQWAQRWASSSDWAPATRRNSESILSRHVLPGVGSHMVTEIRPDDISRWLAAMRKAGVGAPTIEQAHFKLHAMYGEWIKSGRYLPYGNPVRWDQVRKRPRKDFTSPTPSQIAAAANAMFPERQLMLEIEAAYGVRYSEMLALREEDIRFTGKDVTAPLALQLTRLVQLPADEYTARKPQIRWERKLEQDRTPGPMKNWRKEGAIRSVPLLQGIAASLGEHLDRWPAAGGWLWPNRRGANGVLITPEPRPIALPTYRRAVAHAFAAAGYELPPNQCSHALRHYCIGQLKDRGWRDDAIGRWIGITARVVADIYGRPMPDEMDRIAADVAAIRAAGQGPRLRAVAG